MLAFFSCWDIFAIPSSMEGQASTRQARTIHHVRERSSVGFCPDFGAVGG